MGFSDDSDTKESTRECRIHGFDPWVRDPLKEEMATHSSILAWEIWWTEEPGGLQSMVSQRIRRDWVSTVSDGWTPRKWSPNYWFIAKPFMFLSQTILPTLLMTIEPQRPHGSAYLYFLLFPEYICFHFPMSLFMLFLIYLPFSSFKAHVNMFKVHVKYF